MHTMPGHEVVTRFRTRSAEIGAVSISMTRLPSGTLVTRPASAAEPRSIQLLLPVDSALTVRERGGAAQVVGMRELIWLPNWRATAVQCARPVSTVWVELPARVWDKQVALLGSLPARPAPGSLLVEPVRAFVQSLLARGRAAEPLSARLVEELLATMLGALVLEARGSRLGGGVGVGMSMGAGTGMGAGRSMGTGAARPPLRTQAMAHIAAFRQNPELSPQQIARSLRISVRQLQRAFEEAGTTVAAEIRRQRLEVAVGMLSDGAFDSLTVTEVAGRAGFRNDAELRRALAALAGATPSALRARHAA